MSSTEVEIAAYLIVSRQFGSTAMLQRSMSVSKDRAKEIMAELERTGVVGPEIDAGRSARTVLIQPQSVADAASTLRKAIGLA